MTKNYVMTYLKKLSQRIRIVSGTDVLVIFLLNTCCALLSAFHQMYINNADWPVLLADAIEYAKVFNLVGFALLLSYLLLMPGPGQSISFYRMAGIGVLTFVLSWLLSLFIFDWDKTMLPRLWEAATYLMRVLLSSVWVVFILLYLKNRITQPQFQQLQQQVSDTVQQRDQAEMELHLLQAQLEPHFFFNTLANMHNLIDLDPDKAKRLLEELTQYLRACIPQFRQPFIPLAEEIAIIERYLAIQQIRFSRLQFEIIVGPDAAKQLILPMSVLTLVENAIKHGIEKISGEGHILLTAKIEQQQLQVEVRDSAAQPLQTHQGTGLNNLTARLKAAYGTAGHFSMRVEPTRWTIATLGVPLHG